MTKKKNLKFKVGDRVRVVTEPTYGSKKNSWKTNGGAKVNGVYYVVKDYKDGDYDLGTEDTKKFVADSFIGIVHQRHLVLDDTGDAVDAKLAETLSKPSPWGNHINIVPPPLGIGDIVILRDDVTEPYFTTNGVRFKSNRINRNQRYRVGALPGKLARLRRLSPSGNQHDLAVVDADQLEVVRTAAAEQLAKVWRDCIAVEAKTIAGFPAFVPADTSDWFKSVANSIEATISTDIHRLTEKLPVAPKKLGWCDVAVGDKVTATSTVRLLGSSTDSKVTHTDIVGPLSHRGIVYDRDLYWKDLNLTIHQNYDSWTITEIVKAKDLPKPEPKPLDQRRKYQPVKVERIKADDGLWIEHEIRTGQRNAVVEQLVELNGTAYYWVLFADGAKLKLTQFRDKVFVNGQLADYATAETKTHNPA